MLRKIVFDGNTAVVLIDFDNFLKRNLNDYSSNYLKNIFMEIISHIADKNGNVRYIYIRLYGGWYSNGDPTNNYSVLQQKITQFSLFPYRNKTIKISGKIEVTTSLFTKPEILWDNTYKEKEGIRLRINKEVFTDICIENKNICPAKIMTKFTKTKGKQCAVLNCELSNKNIFIGYEKKMIDTMISCDLISFAEEPNVFEIFLISEDEDFLPPLVVLSQKYENSTKEITLCIKPNGLKEKYIEILNSLNVKVEQGLSYE